MRHIQTALQSYAYRPLLVSDTIVVEGLRRTGFHQCSLGIVPAGSSGVQVMHGPEVPGPWGFATTHANVIDSSGQAAAERARAIRIHVGEPFTVEGMPGTWMLRSPQVGRMEGDGAQLAPYDPEHPEAVSFAAAREQQEITIQRARQVAPDDERLIESSNDDAVREASYALACALLDEAG